MASDEQRSPWLPVQPEEQPSDEAAHAAEALLDPAQPAEPAIATAAATPSFDDILAPPPTLPPVSRRGDQPFEITPSRPSVTRPSTTSIPRVAQQEERPQDLAPQGPELQSPALQSPAPPVFSPYLSAEQPIPARNPFEPPAAKAEAPRPEPQQPVLYAPWTGAIPQVHTPEPAADSSPSEAFEPAPASTPDATFEPAAQADAPFLVNGLMPTPIDVDDGEIVAPILPPDATEIQPTGADPLNEDSAPATSEASTPTAQQGSSQDYLPPAADPVRQLAASALSTASLEAAGAPTPRGGIPLIGADGDQIPSFGEDDPFIPRFEPFGGVVPAAVPTVSFTTPNPAPQLRSPLSDLVVPESDEPAYAPREGFVATEPWLEGDASATDAAAQDVTTRDVAVPTPRPWTTVDPADVEFVDGEVDALETDAFPPNAPGVETDDVDASHEAALPTVPSWEGIIGGPEVAPQTPVPHDAAARITPGLFTPVNDVAPALNGEASWEDEVTAREKSFDPDVAVTDAVSQAATEVFPADASAPFGSEATSADAPAAIDPALVSPVASFFAATAARNARRVDDIESAASAVPSETSEATETATSSTLAETPSEELNHETPSDTARFEPIHTAATAYSPRTGEWSKPASTHSDAVTEVDGMAHVQDTTEFAAADVAALGQASISQGSIGQHPIGQNPIDHGPAGPALTHDGSLHEHTLSEDETMKLKIKKPAKTWHLVLWIALAAVIAAGVGIFVYRTYFLPEPVVLPAPTATAAAPAPTAEPVTITDASEFVKAMPTTAGTDVLVAYEVKSPVGDATLPARAAEHVTLEYGPGSSSKVFTVEAYQHYNVDDATKAYDSYAAGATDVKDVAIDGKTVGKRAYSATGSTGTVVWRNGTAVFNLTGPADKVLDFFEHYGV